LLLILYFIDYHFWFGRYDILPWCWLREKALIFHFYLMEKLITWETLKTIFLSFFLLFSHHFPLSHFRNCEIEERKMQCIYIEKIVYWIQLFITLAIFFYIYTSKHLYIRTINNRATEILSYKQESKQKVGKIIKKKYKKMSVNII